MTLHTHSLEPTATAFLTGGGVMGARMRAHPWHASPLGPAERWPQSLKTLVSLMLGSTQPMFIIWGAERVWLYNDAMIPLMGKKHPAALGEHALDVVWGEAREALAPLFATVFAGTPVRMDDITLDLDRHGRLEEAHFAFSYTPVRQETGEIGGLFGACIDTTERIRAERQAKLEGQRFQQLFEQAPTFMAVLRGPEHRFEYANPGYYSLIGHRDVVGRTVAEALPDAAAQGYVGLLDGVYRSGQAFAGRGSKYAMQAVPGGSFEERYVDFVYQPIRNAEGDVDGIFVQGVDTTDRAQAERQTRTLARLTDELRNLENIADISHAAGMVLGEALDVGRVGYGTVDVRNESVTGEREWSAPGVQGLAGVRNLRDFGTFADDLKAGAVVVINDVRVDPRTNEPAVSAALIARHAAAFVNVPVVENGQTVAVLYVANGIPRMWSREDLQLIQEVAARTHTVVERSRAVVAVRKNEAQLRFLDALGKEAAKLTEADAILATITRMLAEHLNVTVSAYADMDDDQDGFTIRGEWVDSGAPSILGHYNLRDFGALAVRNLSAGVPLVINDNLRELPPEDAAAFQSLGLRATICMPLVKQGRLIALMAVHDKAPRLWTEEELFLLREVTQRSWAHVERAGAEQELRESERRYRTLFNAIDEGFCIIEFFDGPHGPLSDYVHVEANPAYAVHAGIPNVVGQKVREMVGAEADGWIDLYAGVLRTGKPIRFERELEATRRWLSLAAFRVEPANSRQVAVLFQDITARKQAEIALRASEDNFRTLTLAMPNQAWTAAPDGMLDWFNDQVYAFGGAAPGTLDGAGWTRMVHSDDLPGAGARWAQALASGETYEVEFRLRRADDTYRWHIARAVPMKNAAGQVVRWIGTNTDIHDQKAAAEALSDLAATLEHRVEERTTQLMVAEEALRQSQKMEAVGQLTGGIAHDFNNLLTGISGSLEMLGKRLAEGRTTGVDRYLASAQEASKRAAALTQRLLAFSRRQTLDPKPVDVNKLIAGMETLIRGSVGPDVKVEVAQAVGLWATRIDGAQLENALLNLCINGRDAMAPHGGRLTIETANKWLDERAARERELAPGQYVSLCVTDTGSGMSPEIIQRAFDPFFTTKPIGQGTGLGLSMVYGFVRQSGGQVRIYSELGVGTTMCLYLPRYFGDVDERHDGPSPETSERGAGETVLVVDDEPLLRMLMLDALQDNGYRAIEAIDGPSALKILESDARIDLLITDVGLPGGMNGRQVADAARRTRSDLKVLFVTGFAENAVVGNGHLAPGMEIVTKPFEIAAFEQKVRDMIEGGTRAR